VSQDVPPLRAVFFDIGETLVRPRRPHAALLAEICREQGVALDSAALAAFGDHIAVRVAARARAGLPFTFPAEESRRFWQETYRGYLEQYLSVEAARRVASAYQALLSAPAGYTLFEDALPTLEGLRARGLTLGIVSNWAAWLPKLLAETGLAPLFDHVVISGLCRIEKPDPRVFALALAAGGFRSVEVAYVGDSPAHDVAPARAMGIAPVLLDRAGHHGLARGVVRITALAALPAALRI